MIKALTAYTQEIDDVEAAVSEVLEQIDFSMLNKNSIGILTCYSEFIDSGVVKALCEKLPFNVIGCTTMGNATNGDSGHLELTLLIITGDDVEFSAAVSSPLSDEQDAPLRKMYCDSLKKLENEPVFIIAFMPLIYNIGGEVFLNILDDESGLPIFGTLAVDHTNDYHESKTIFNGDAYVDSVSMVVISGNVSPKFYVGSLSNTKVLKQKAIITSSELNILKEVNGIPVVKYMESLGLTRDGQIEGPSTIPFIVDFNDGTKPVIRAVFAQTPEGYAVCGGVMPVNSTLSIGSLDYNDVMSTTKKVADEILEEENINALIMFSCVGRNYALGIKTKDEMEEVEKTLINVPYQLTYSGGEICPMCDNDGRLINRFHNDTIIACVI